MIFQRYGVQILEKDCPWWIFNSVTFLIVKFSLFTLFITPCHILISVILFYLWLRIQAANVYLCDDSILPLVLPTEELKNELNKRKVYFKEDDSREVLIHLLEMDILLRSSGEFQLNYSFTEVKGGYVDYRIRRITPFDVFNNVYGKYTGPMLSKLLKEKGITPPRWVVDTYIIDRRVKDRVQLVVNRIDMAMRESFRVVSIILSEQ